MPAESSQPSYEQLLAENAALRALVADLTARLDTAMGRIADLEAQLKQSSKNSSKPPSADGLAKPAPKSLRGKSGRGPGRPAGQPGATLEQVADPDVIVRHIPSVCAGCRNDLTGAAEVAVTRRQVFDIPQPRVVVTEHQCHGTQACSRTWQYGAEAYTPKDAARTVLRCPASSGQRSPVGLPGMESGCAVTSQEVLA